MVVLVVSYKKSCANPYCENQVPVDGFGSARRIGPAYFCSEECEVFFIGIEELEELEESPAGEGDGGPTVSGFPSRDAPQS